MTDYMLLLRGGQGPGQDGAEVSPAEMQAYLAPYQQWLADLSRNGQLVHARCLLGDGSKVLRGGDGGTAVIDGPYTESKDIVGGYHMVRAASPAEAVEIARKCPHLANRGIVELRPAADD